MSDVDKEKSAAFIEGAASSLLFVLPAALCLSCGIMNFMGVCDFELTLVATKRKMFTESVVFEDEVRAAVDERIDQMVHQRK